MKLSYEECAVSPDKFFKCMADETRLICLMLITQEKELCVCELTEALAASQPKVSRHLAQLRDCGLLKDRREGKWVFYSLHHDLPLWVTETITLVAQESPDFYHSHHQRLLNMRSRPERMNLCC